MAVKRVRPYFCCSALDRQRHAHAAADAQRSNALLGVASLHFVQQGHKDAATRGADGVTDGDRAAVDVAEKALADLQAQMAGTAKTAKQLATELKNNVVLFDTWAGRVGGLSVSGDVALSAPSSANSSFASIAFDCSVLMKK
mgnify:CR=1 FL=1